mmetsp:Transcript_26548/g.48163  ORF Transcript_26548/g.48163 Transcript_26548/m.48163 type:complete len:933 (-) Transcript_26548:132-2930(-)
MGLPGMSKSKSKNSNVSKNSKNRGGTGISKEGRTKDGSFRTPPKKSFMSSILRSPKSKKTPPTRPSSPQSPELFLAKLHRLRRQAELEAEADMPSKDVRDDIIQARNNNDAESTISDLSGSYKTTSRETKLAALARANDIRKTPEANTTAVAKTNNDKPPSCLMDSLYEYISVCNPKTFDEAQTISTDGVKEYKPTTAVWGMAPTRDEDSEHSGGAEDSFTTDTFGKSTAATPYSMTSGANISADESVEMSFNDSRRVTPSAVRKQPRQESDKLKSHPQGDIMRNLSYPPVRVSSMTNASNHNRNPDVSKSQYTAVFGDPVKDDDSATGFAVLYSGIMKNLKKSKGKISKKKGKNRESTAVDNVSFDERKESTAKFSARKPDDSGENGGISRERSATVGFSSTEDIKKSEESKLPPALSTMRSWSFSKKKSRSNDYGREDSFEGMDSQEKVELKKSRSTPLGLKKSRSTPLGFLSMMSKKDLKEPIESKEQTKPNPPAQDQAKPKLTWKSAVDAKTGRKYYYNTETKETKWIKPETFDEDMKKYLESKKKYLEYKKQKAEVSNSLARDCDENAPFDESAPFDEHMGLKSTKSFESEVSNVLFLNGGDSKKKLNLSNCRTQSTLSEGVQSRAVSLLTERTQRIDNTGGRGAVKTSPDYAEDSDISLSSADSNVSEKKGKRKNKQPEAKKSKSLYLRKENVPKMPIHDRRREIEAEELTGIKHGLRERKNVENTPPLGANRSNQNVGEVEGVRESSLTSRDNTASTPEDSLSTMSDRDDDFQNKTGENKVEDSGPATPINQNPNEWTQTEIDKFISTSDWNSVAEYIAHVRKEQPEESKREKSGGKKQVRMTSSVKRSSQRKLVARSRAQQDDDDSDSSSGSGSYDSSDDSDDSSYRNRKKKEVTRKTRKTISRKKRPSTTASIAQQWFEGTLF